MRVALALSPHLDDAAFSCGGILARLVQAGWRVVMATAFTRSIHPAEGFALACQLDKGLPATVDYMALRRAEDAAAAAALGVEPRWLDLPEAPHRGYDSAPALFGEALPDDAVWRDLSWLIVDLVAELKPALVLSCQGLGRHVDHRQMIRAVEHARLDTPTAYYRDTPYAMRNPAALPCVEIVGLSEVVVTIADALAAKVAASCAYGSQVGFQFGGAAATAAALEAFSQAEGGGRPAERLLARGWADPFEGALS